MQETQDMQGFHPWLWKIPWRRAWQPTPVFLSEKSQGQRSLVGHKEQDMTEHARIYCYEHSEGCSVFSRLFATTWMVTCQAPLCPWNFPGKNTGVCCHSLLQGIFPTQGSNLGLKLCRQIFYYLSHQGSPRTLEWIA